jgi:hypothetical protein
MYRIIAAFFILAVTLTAQDPQWERMKTLRQGEIVWVRYLDGNELKDEQARLMAWTEDSLAIRVHKKDVVISRNDVRRVRVYHGKSHPKGLLWGALIGLAPGLGVGALCGAVSEGSYTGACMAAWGGLGSGVGAAIGAAVGTTRKAEVYQASAK